MDPLVPFIKAVIIMDGEGNRLSSKYYAREEFPTEVDRVSELSLLFRGVDTAAKRPSRPRVSQYHRKPSRTSCSRRRSTRTRAQKVGRWWLLRVALCLVLLTVGCVFTAVVPSPRS